MERVSPQKVDFKWLIAWPISLCCCPVLPCYRKDCAASESFRGVRRCAEKGLCKRLAKKVQQQGFSSCTASYQVKHLQDLFPSRGNSEYKAEKTVLRIFTLKKAALLCCVQGELTHLCYSLLWVKQLENCVTSAQENCKNRSVVIY